MIEYEVIFSPAANAQLLTLYEYIADATSPYAAELYTSAIVEYCEGLNIFPLRGTKRDDIRPGLRVTNYRKRAVIAFAVDTRQVSIIGVYYGGQDYESALIGEGDSDN